MSTRCAPFPLIPAPRAADDHVHATRLTRVCAAISVALSVPLAALLLHGCATLRAADAAHPAAQGWREGWVTALRHADDPVDVDAMDCRGLRRNDSDGAAGDYLRLRYSRSRHWKHALVDVDATTPASIGDRVWFQPAGCAAPLAQHVAPGLTESDQGP